MNEFVAIIANNKGLRVGGQRAVRVYCAIVTYLLTEIDLDTVGSHFELIEYPLKIEAAHLLT
jgi:hypothetical protein